MILNGLRNTFLDSTYSITFHGDDEIKSVDDVIVDDTCKRLNFVF